MALETHIVVFTDYDCVYFGS